MTTHALILCTRDSGRSVLSEGMLNHFARAALQAALTEIGRSRTRSTP